MRCRHGVGALHAQGNRDCILQCGRHIESSFTYTFVRPPLQQSESSFELDDPADGGGAPADDAAATGPADDATGAPDAGGAPPADGGSRNKEQLDAMQKENDEAEQNMMQDANAAFEATRQRADDGAHKVADAAAAAADELKQKLGDAAEAEQRDIQSLYAAKGDQEATEDELKRATRRLEEAQFRNEAANGVIRATGNQWDAFDAYSGHYKSVHAGYNTVERQALRHHLF